MELKIKHFNELSAKELYEIYRVRTAVFVVEQNCPYQEVDEADLASYHIFLEENETIYAYLRVIPKGIRFEEVSIGRVLTIKRNAGFGRQILQAGIETAKTVWNASCIKIEAQLYAKGFYEKAGFVQTSDMFLEDGIEHIEMKWYADRLFQPETTSR